MAVACFLMPQFGIAVERTRLTHLWGEPVALESSEGTLAAISDEAAAAGIRAGQAVNGARATCERLVVLPYDREAYEEAAHPVWDLFAIESSVVEPVSPELCYVELTGPDIVKRAQQLADELTARIRITVRAGVGRTKLVARRAAIEGRRQEAGGRKQSAGGSRQERMPGFQPVYSDPDMVREVMQRPGPSSSLPTGLSSPSGLSPCRDRDAPTPPSPLPVAASAGDSGRGAHHVAPGKGAGGVGRNVQANHPLAPSPLHWVRPGREAEFLASLPLEKAPGIDYRLVKRLQRLGVKTLGDIPKIPPRELRRQLKEVALLLQRLAEGEDGDRVRPLWPPRRIEKTIAFEDEVCDRATVEEALRRCAESIAASLLQKHEYCRTVILTVQLADGSYLQESEKPAIPLDAEKTI
ncbi:MAG TPA: hypothetical protein VF889_09000, partial [Bacteroidota bacterium]